MNLIPATTARLIRAMRAEGHSIRRVAKALSVAPNTVARYAAMHTGDLGCACGAVRHAAWCRPRLRAMRVGQAQPMEHAR